MNNNPAWSSALKGVYLVPGLPLVLQPDMNQGYARLHLAAQSLGPAMAASGVERIVYFSTQWLSVLGPMFQSRPRLEGIHVDDNWHDLPDLAFDFTVDRDFATLMATTVKASGFQSHMVDYEGFPVDTGTIVADRLVNPRGLPVGMVSAWVYADDAKMVAIGELVREAIERDGKPTAVVAVSLLSANFFTTLIDRRTDQIRDPSDDHWNLRLLGRWESGDHEAAERIVPEYVTATKADLGLRAYAFLKGVTQGQWHRPARCHGYAALYGAGAAVVEF